MAQSRDRSKRDTVTKSQGWLKPLNDKGYILIKFQLDGKTYKLNPVRKGRFDNVSDYRQAWLVCEQIEWDIRKGEFDTTLEKYKPKVEASERPPEQNPALTLGKLWGDYKKDKELVVAKTTQNGDWRQTDIAIEKCKLTECLDFNQVKDALLDKYSLSRTRVILTMLTASLNHSVKKGLLTNNPLNQATIDIKKAEKNQRLEKGTTSRKSFTNLERDRIIKAFESNEFCPKSSAFKHSYYAPFVKFLFFTGCRTEDAIALIWGDIQGNQVVFSKAHSKGILKGSKNAGHDGKAIRKVPINAQLAAILDTYKASLPPEKTKPECLMFPSVTGRYLVLDNFTRRIWSRIVEALVKAGEIREYLPTYNCRHTFITLCLEATVPVHTVAKWVGNSPEVIYSNYCSDVSQIQVPDLT